jgi:sulfatase maturation enzyme AslB (radical SAM superfamily)
MTDAKNSFSSMKKKLNEISPSFCAAKWTQVTLHLHNGRTHSCHHPSTHKIPLEELQHNPSALHNTCFKKQQRKAMLDGNRPSECQYCWNVEDLPDYNKDEFFSDRVVKSASYWSKHKIDEITTSSWDSNFNPTYVEVSFSNICNFKCSYCGPSYSSRWTEEVETHGPYPTSGRLNGLDYLRQTDQMPIHHKQHNPYVEAFWEWWPTMVKHLRVFRITGGEPLLANDTYKVLDYLYNEPQPWLELAINTNACVPDSKINDFMQKATKLITEKKIRDFHIFTSVDGHGKAAEYGRFGLSYEKWLANVDRFLTELPDVKITIMSTVNVLSITSYERFLVDVLDLKRKHGANRLNLDIAILRYPHHQCVSILTDPLKTSMDSAFAFMKANQDRSQHGHFTEFEILRMERFVSFMRSPPHPNERMGISTARNDFAIFVDEHDRRRGTNFKETFPELLEFYETCKIKKTAKLSDSI